MSHGVHSVGPDFWTWLNGHAGVLTFAVALITLAVAVITVVVAERTRKSQLRSERLQEQTKAIQEEATRIQQETYDSQKRATEIQDRMDARDLEFRKSRADIALTRLLQQIHFTNNLITENFPGILYSLLQSIEGWSENLYHLPQCKLKFRAEKTFASIVPPKAGAAVNLIEYNKPVLEELQRLIRDLNEEGLLNGCREAIKNMQ